MALLVDAQARRSALQFAAQRPVEGFNPGFAARFEADRQAMVNFSNIDAERTARMAAVDPFIKQFKDASGQDLSNWGSAALNEQAYGMLQEQAKRQFEVWKTQNPDSQLTFPDDERIKRDSDAFMLRSRQQSQRLSERSNSFGSGLGGFLGTAVGAMQDPMNLLSLGLGGGSQGVVKLALTEGAIAGGSEALIQTATLDRKKRVDPSFTTDEATSEIAAAAFGGVVLGAGPKAIANLWHKARTGTWPRHVRDAANVVSREAAVPPSRIGKSAGASAAHRGALEKAADDLARGKSVELPPDLFMKAGARPGRVYDADGRSVGVEYQVVEADTLVTSHDENLVTNPAFPPELQPRDRSRAISRDQINSIARNLQPERLGPSTDAGNGAPIVGADGIVESGNGRVLAMRQAYGENGIPAENYRNFLKAQGFELEGFNRPVMIARRITALEDADRVGFVTAANRATAMRLGTVEQARSDARFIDDAMLERLAVGKVDAASNRGFVSGFMAKLPRAEQGSLVDKSGALSLEGERRVHAALMARAYDEPAFLARALEDTDSNIKGLAGALADASPKWVRMRDAVASGAVPQGMDLTQDVMDAMRVVMKARDEGVAVRDLVNQAEMFGGLSETGKIVARAMFNSDMTRGASRAKVAKFLGDYADEAMKNTADDRLFGEALGAGDVLKTALNKAERADLLAEAERRLTPENIDKMAASDETVDAVIMEANRLREQALVNKADSPKIDLGDGAGERSLDDVFDEADDEIAAAKDIEACSTGAGTAQPAGNGDVARALAAPRKVTFDADGNVTGFETDLSGSGGNTRSALSGNRRLVKDMQGNITGDETA
jgi:hypothetical protein